jgi:hypothetical protein
METISWNSFGEGDYDDIDYITIDGHSFSLDMIQGASFSGESINISFKVRHGFKSFIDSLKLIASENTILTARVSNYHGGYLLVSGVVTFEGESLFTLPNIMTVVFKAENVKLDTYSEFDETQYLTEVQKKD